MDPRERALALVLQHGWNATAFQTLEPGYEYWFHGDDACTAYVDTGRAWVVAGAPIAAHAQLGEVTRAFTAAARSAGRRCCFFGTEERFVAATPELRHLYIGAQPVWEPASWTATLEQQRSLREQLRRAQAKGVHVRLVAADELRAGPVREGIREVARRWLATRRTAEMGFLVRLEPFTFPEHRRCFIAERENRIVAFAGVVPVPARDGWFVEDLVRDPEAPNGTGELLVDAVMQKAKAEGCHWLTLGLAPLAGDLIALLDLARWSARGVYDFEGLYRFKAKLRPRSWSPIYLSHPTSQGNVRSLADALTAFAHCSLWRFAVRSLLRGPPVVLRTLAILLVPWAVLLAFAPAEHWFGSALVKWAWVAFDTAMAAALFHFARRPVRALATVLASAATADALLTLLQFVLWNAHQLRRVPDYLLAALALLAPAFAAAVLWGARRGLVTGSAR
jgi:phosphatidylglycerol lysyltransferase